MQSLYQIPPQRKPMAYSVGSIVMCTCLQCLVIFKNSSLPTHCTSWWTIWPGIGSTPSAGAKKVNWKESPPHLRIQAGEKVHVLLTWEVSGIDVVCQRTVPQAPGRGSQLLCCVCIGDMWQLTVPSPLFPKHTSPLLSKRKTKNLGSWLILQNEPT